jgi:phosphoglycolate phosphatase-like HAD superfamily hydrolase/ADP-ribose pyrophosphatase YjhB (NUDIX family)
MNVIFDWAGTLADDQELTWRLTDQVIREAGHPSVPFETYRREFTLPAAGFYAAYCPGTPWERIEADFREACRRRYPAEVVLHAGVREGIACLACRHKLFLFSTLDQAMLVAALDRLGLRDRFSAVRGSVEDKTRVLPGLLQEWGLVQDETLFIGDTPHDLRAARAAGVAGIAVTYGYASAQALAAEVPEVALGSFTEVIRYLDKASCAESRHFPVATVGGLIRDAEGNFLLVRTRKWSGLYGIPGGKIDYGETMEAAFVREAREETGLAVRDLEFAMAQDCVEHPEFYRPRHFILVNYLARVDGVKPPPRLNHESDAYRWATPAEALAMPLNRPTRVLIEKVIGKAVDGGSEI